MTLRLFDRNTIDESVNIEEAVIITIDLRLTK